MIRPPQPQYQHRYIQVFAKDDDFPSPQYLFCFVFFAYAWFQFIRESTLLVQPEANIFFLVADMCSYSRN